MAAMENVLEVYARPFDSQRPVVCLDEGAKQLLCEVREPLPMKPGQPLRFDNESQRNGTCALFMLFEPLAAKRFVQVEPGRQTLCASQATTHVAGLRSGGEGTVGEGTVRHVVSRSPQNHLGAGQPQHSRPACALSSLCAPRSAPLMPAHRVALHPQTRLLAQQGRTRTFGLGPSVSPRAHGVTKQLGATSSSVATKEKPNRNPRQLALHDPRRQNQTQTTVSHLTTRLDHYIIGGSPKLT